MSSQCATNARQGRRLQGRTKAPPSFMGLFLAGSVVGTLLLQSTLVLASSPIDMCMDATKDIQKEVQKFSLEYSAVKHSVSLEPTMEGNVWSFEYPVESRMDYEFRCNEMVTNNDLPEGKSIIWLDPSAPKTIVELTCSSPELNVTGIPVHFSGLESCFANVTDCRESDPMDLLLLEAIEHARLECGEAPSSSEFTDYDGSVAVFKEHVFNMCNWGTSQNLLALGRENTYGEDDAYAKAQTRYKSFVEFQTTETDDKWSIGYPNYGVDGYKSACETYNNHLAYFNKGPVDAFWLGLDENVTLTCDKPSKNIVGKTVEFYGIGGCFANTPSCLAVEPMDLLKDLWKKDGLECRALDDDIGSDEDGGDQDAAEEENEGVKDDVDGVPTDTDTTEEEDAAEDLVPGENADSEDQLPFLLSEDMECMGDSADFVENIPGLKSAVESFQNTEVISEESSEFLIGHPSEAVDAMKSACELNKGHWVFVKSEQFTCVVEGMMTEAVKVHNFGSCLAKTDDCLAMDTTSLLQVHLHDLGYNCWLDEHDDREDQESPIEHWFDPASDDEVATLLKTSGLSESDLKCEMDTVLLANMDLNDAEDDYYNAMELDCDSLTEVLLTFPDENVEEVRSLCNDIGAYFTIVERKEFVCDRESVKVNVVMENMAECRADTDECRNMSDEMMLEVAWVSVGLKHCEEGDLTESEATGFGAEQTKANPSDGDSRSSSHTAGIALGLSVVGAIGLFGFFRYRAKRGRERASATARQYEMTQFSDLGFSVFT